MRDGVQVTQSRCDVGDGATRSNVGRYAWDRGSAGRAGRVGLPVGGVAPREARDKGEAEATKSPIAPYREGTDVVGAQEH